MTRCTKCLSSDTSVKDSRPCMKDDIIITKRRRMCLGCGHRLSTFEVTEGFLESKKLERMSNLARQLYEVMQE